MAEERFIDYFDYAELKPSDTREINYERLKKLHIELKDKRSKDAKLAEDNIGKAMAIFSTPQTYEAYRVRWEQRQAGQAPTAGQTPSAGPQPKGFKAALLEIGANALKNAIESRANATGPGANATGPGAGLTGLWRDNMGATLQIRQVGTNISVTVTNGFGQVVAQGRGILNGTRIDYEARDAAGQSGRGVLMVSPDGSRIEGEISWSNGFNMPTGSGRVLLVRAG
jgi:hypothetical protein